jgi:DNA polymerase III subunit delta'
MLEELERHPNALAVLGPALGLDPTRHPNYRAPSHAYLFYGPGGSGKRALTREIAARLLSQGAPDPASAQARALAGVHPDLTWVVPSGAHEILVSDIDGPVVAAASKTPFESARRVFVIESADQLGDESANRLLKTLEEPASFVHIILITDRLGDVLPTIRSRCQVVRFEAPSEASVTSDLVAGGVAPDVARASARLSLGDATRARALAQPEGVELREQAQVLVRGALGGAAGAPWDGLLSAVKARGELVRIELEERAAAELELLPSRERKRAETDWTERGRRARRRVETGALEMGLDLIEAWLLDLVALAFGAAELVRNSDRIDALRLDSGVGRGGDAGALRRAVELVEDTRQRFQLNVSEDLALEAMTYRLASELAG